MALGTGLLNAVVTGLVTGSVIALAAIGLGLVYSIAEVPNLAHGELITIGAYLALTVNNPADVPLLDLLAPAGTLTLPGMLVVVVLTAAAVLWSAIQLGGYEALYGSWWPIAPAGWLAFSTHVALAGLLGILIAIGAPNIWLGMLFAAIVLAAATPLLETRVFRKFRKKGVPIDTILIVSLGLTFAFRFSVQAIYGSSLRSYEISASSAKFFDFYLTNRGLWFEVINSATEPNTSLFVVSFQWFSLGIVLLGTIGTLIIAYRWRNRSIPAHERRTVGPWIVGFVGSLITFLGLTVVLARAASRPDVWEYATRVRLSVSRAIVVAIAITLIAVLHVLLSETKLGIAMRASSDNIDLAKVTGINTQRVLIVTWMLAGVTAAVSGVFLGVLFNQITVNMGFFLLLPIFGAVILGGVSSPYGGILGGMLIGFSMEVGIHLIPNAGQVYRVPIAFAVLFVVLLVKPEGILGGGA